MAAALEAEASERELMAPLMEMDPQVWKTCAGSAAARIPAVGSRVFYFPQGHAEQASSSPDFSVVPSPLAATLCRISRLRLLADPYTDEVFARINLYPLVPSRLIQPPHPPKVADRGDAGGFVSHAKTLTPSDANNGGGFSVPKSCADKIFPPLNFSEDIPVQNLTIRDVHGNSWSFRHIYRGTPRRHLLTTGWSTFVNSKKLIAGDSVVFMKNLSGQLFVGTRRASRSCGPVPYDPTAAASNAGFSRNVSGRVLASSVIEAAKLAGKGLPFEVSYYPSAGSPDFVVEEAAVVAATRVRWTTELRVRMPVEGEDYAAGATWFRGTVSSVAMNDVLPWPSSIWRMLQVTLEGGAVLQNVRNVSPWQVELVSASPQVEPPDDAEEKMPVQMTGSNRETIGSLNPLGFFYSAIPAGMQGARHDTSFLSSSYDTIMGTNQTSLIGLHGVNAPQNDITLELSIGVTSSGIGSSSSQGSNQVTDKNILEPASKPVESVSTRSFRLFGQYISM